MTQLPQAMALLGNVFDKYAGKDGDSKTLTKNELSELLHKELDMKPSNKGDVDKFFKALDNDGDGVVNFQEYVTFVAALCSMCKGQ
ncbi:ictacalcin-like [Sebastes fasciatus]|uniref:ictacalcin-like n=1 Tax=Sebastes fasciatus TaxID=394691 RepID=UPI003D9E8845